MSDQPISKPSPKRMVWFVGAMTVWWSVSFLASVTLLHFFAIPTGNKEILVYMLGQLSGLTTSFALFWVGTTHQGGLKTEMIAKAEPIKE